jgi:hypothetical protein
VRNTLTVAMNARPRPLRDLTIADIRRAAHLWCEDSLWLIGLPYNKIRVRDITTVGVD